MAFDFLNKAVCIPDSARSERPGLTEVRQRFLRSAAQVERGAGRLSSLRGSIPRGAICAVLGEEEGEKDGPCVAAAASLGRRTLRPRRCPTMGGRVPGAAAPAPRPLSCRRCGSSPGWAGVPAGTGQQAVLSPWSAAAGRASGHPRLLLLGRSNEASAEVLLPLSPGGVFCFIPHSRGNFCAGLCQLILFQEHQQQGCV